MPSAETRDAVAARPSFFHNSIARRRATEKKQAAAFP
jgi:hypothetical protein